MLAAIESDSITSDWKYLTNTVTLCNLGLDDGYSDMLIQSDRQCTF